MRYPIKDKFWEWRMDPFEVFAYWDSKENQPQLTLTRRTGVVRIRHFDQTFSVKKKQTIAYRISTTSTQRYSRPTLGLHALDKQKQCTGRFQKTRQWVLLRSNLKTLCKCGLRPKWRWIQPKKYPLQYFFYLLSLSSTIHITTRTYTCTQHWTDSQQCPNINLWSQRQIFIAVCKETGSLHRCAAEQN